MELLIQKFKSLLEKIEKFNSIKVGKSCNKILKGGSGSGNFGHAGRVGEVGGSSTGSDGYVGQGGSGKGGRIVLGDKIKVSEGSGLASGKIATIVDRTAIKLDGRGIPKNVEGAYRQPNWNKEFAIKYEDGTYDIIPKNRVTIVKGGSGSGNFGHSGRIGEVGGSDGDGDGDNYKPNDKTYQGYNATTKSINDLQPGEYVSMDRADNEYKDLKNLDRNKYDIRQTDHGVVVYRIREDNAPGSGVREHLFNADNAQTIVVNRFKEEIKVPSIHSYVSTLGGKEQASVLLRVSLDPENTWNNGILENSRYALFSIDRKGYVDAFTQSYKIANRFRSGQAKNIDDVINKINKWAEKNK